MRSRGIKLGIGLIGFVAASAYAQTADGQPSFEVASIKPAPPPDPRGMRVGMRGGPGSRDPGLYTCENCSLSDMVRQAYDVVPYQLSAPGWMENERFNTTAKIPLGATKDQFKLMMQNLLADRFKLTIHHEKKEMQMFDLVVAKGGPKMTESVKESAEDAAKRTPGSDGSGPAPPPPLPPPPPLGAGRGDGPPRPNIDKDGYPAIPAGCKNCMMVMNGRARMQNSDQTMEEFAKQLSRQLGKPVTDATGLKAKYDFSLTFDMASLGSGRGGPPPPGGGGSPEANTPLANAPDNDSGPTLMSAVQSQLGLKLEQKKGQVDIIVVDHVEKVPTEN